MKSNRKPNRSAANRSATPGSTSESRPERPNSAKPVNKKREAEKNARDKPYVAPEGEEKYVSRIDTKTNFRPIPPPTKQDADGGFEIVPLTKDDEEEDPMMKAEQPVKAKKVKEPKPEKKHRGQAKREAQEDAAAAEETAPVVKEEVKKVIQESAPEEAKADVFSGDKFSDLPINDKLKQALATNSFVELTSIQKKAIPAIIKDQNVIMKSETGSGKTLAYLVPLIEKLSVHSMEVEKIRRDYGTYCIIFSPTRELAAQIDIELQRLTSKMFAYMVCSCIMGGENPKKEKARLRKGITILVCTPGRFLYHL